MQEVTYKNRIMPVMVAILFPVLLKAQVHISAGTKLVANGNVVMVVENNDMQNDGDFVPGTSSFIFTGNRSAPTLIGGSRPLSFHNITIQQPLSETRLENNITVSGKLKMIEGNIQLNSYNINLGTSGIIMGERNDARINGTGTIKCLAILNSPQSVNPGNIGVELTSAANMGATTITRGHIQQTAANGEKSIHRYFEISPEFNKDLKANIRFFYFDAELGSQGENKLSLFSGEDGSSGWKLAGKDQYDWENNWVAKTGIDEMHRFTLAIPIRVQSPENIYGRARIYPNPCRDHFKLTFFSNEEKTVVLNLYDQLGYLLEQKKIISRPGLNYVDWNVSGYAAATYRVAFQNMESQSIQLLKQ